MFSNLVTRYKKVYSLLAENTGLLKESCKQLEGRKETLHTKIEIVNDKNGHSSVPGSLGTPSHCGNGRHRPTDRTDTTGENPVFLLVRYGLATAGRMAPQDPSSTPGQYHPRPQRPHPTLLSWRKIGWGGRKVLLASHSPLTGVQTPR